MWTILWEEGLIRFKRVLVLRKIEVRTRSAQYISRCRRLTELAFLLTSLWSQKCKIEGQKCKIAGHPWKSQRTYGYTKDENKYLNEPSFNQNQREYFEWSILVSPNPFSKPLDSNNKCIALTITVSCPYLFVTVSSSGIFGSNAVFLFAWSGGEVEDYSGNSLLVEEYLLRSHAVV